MSRVAVVGSRTFENYEFLKAVLDIYHKSFSEIYEIVSGGAKGADSLAEKYAKEKEIPVKLILPDWDKYGKAAGMIRNTTIVENATAVIAFWDGKSKGTKDSIDKALKLKKDLFVFLFEPTVIESFTSRKGL